MRTLAVSRPCIGCGDIFQPFQRDVNKGGGKYCRRECYRKNHVHGYGHGYISTQGYVIRDSVKKTPEHRIVAELAFGGPLPRTAIIHHHNEDKADNANGNLVICENRAYHNLIHARMRVVKRGGDPDTHQICGDCNTVLPFSAFYADKNNNIRGLHQRCKPCFLLTQKLSRIRRLAVAAQ